jgi:hypothetical protein
MWGSLLGLALLISLNPMLLGMILLVVARPRPVQNLFVYWVGAMLVNVPLFLVPLLLLHAMPGFAAFGEGLATPAEPSLGVIQPVALGLAAVLLGIAAVMLIRPRMRARAEVSVGGGGDASISVMEPDAPRATPGLLGGARDAAVNVASAIQRLYGRLIATWENGSLWVALVFGMMYLPSATLVLLIDTTIVASGAGIGEQAIAAVVFVVGFLAILELVLIGYAIAPVKTEIFLRPLHEWARVHNRHILIVFFVLIGVWQLARGLGIA